MVIALIVGGAINPQVGDQSRGHIDAAPMTTTTLASREAGPVIDAPELLSEEEIAGLSEHEIEEILEESGEEVADAQADYASEASAAEYAKAVAAYEAIRTELEQVIEEGGVEALAELGTSSDTSAPTIVSASLSKACMTVYKWQLQTIAWVFIGFGALYSIAGLFVAVTGVGLPAGAILGALGIGIGVTAQFFLWKVDQQRWNSKRVCF